MFGTLGWKPRQGTLYRGWAGDGRHSVKVEAVIDKIRYPAAFKVYHALDVVTEKGLEECEIFVLPTEYQQLSRSGRILRTMMARAFRFTVDRRHVRIQKKQNTETLPPVQGYRTTFVKFKTINYTATVKELDSEVRMKFRAWLNSIRPLAASSNHSRRR